MSLQIRKTLLGLLLLAGIVILVAGAVVWSGTYNVGADDPHWRSTYALLNTARERSIRTRAAKLQLPSDLGSPERIRQGAGNYAAMCAGCHLAPGMGATEISKGLYPAPPDLTKAKVDPARAFWVIKHGIKGSGMPAWGLSMEDEYVWSMAAFLQELPKLDAARYAALVESSEGHSHGGGETQPHEHGAGMDDHHDEADEGPRHEHPPGTPPHEDAPKQSAPMEATPHAHAPGTPPHDDSAATSTPNEAKPHSHSPGTPPHDDSGAATPTVPPADGAQEEPEHHH